MNTLADPQCLYRLAVTWYRPVLISRKQRRHLVVTDYAISVPPSSILLYSPQTLVRCRCVPLKNNDQCILHFYIPVILNSHNCLRVCI